MQLQPLITSLRYKGDERQTTKVLAADRISRATL
jgi:hypothetical protein